MFTLQESNKYIFLYPSIPYTHRMITYAIHICTHTNKYNCNLCSHQSVQRLSYDDRIPQHCCRHSPNTGRWNDRSSQHLKANYNCCKLYKVNCFQLHNFRWNPKPPSSSRCWEQEQLTYASIASQTVLTYMNCCYDNFPYNFIAVLFLYRLMTKYVT